MKTFLMCVGAQKAGTTWLWHYLRKNPKVDLGFKKEYHVWEVCTNPFFKFLKLELEESIAGGHRTPNKLAQLSFMDDPNLYFDYFLHKLQSVDVTGDFTPQSSSLTKQTFNHIISTFNQYNVTTKAIYILRDPVDRLQSMIKMKLLLSGHTNPTYDVEYMFMDKFALHLSYTLSGDYCSIVPKLDDVFGSNVHYSVYESLFNNLSTKQITDFLSISHHVADFNFNPRPSMWTNTLNEQDRSYFEQLYKPIYDYTAERFPEVKTLWTYYQK